MVYEIVKGEKEMSVENIRELMKGGENRKLEFKKSLNMKKEIGQTVSAFANTCEGTILISVSDSEEVVGVDIGKDTVGKKNN